MQVTSNVEVRARSRNGSARVLTAFRAGTTTAIVADANSSTIPDAVEMETTLAIINSARLLANVCLCLSYG